MKKIILSTGTILGSIALASTAYAGGVPEGQAGGSAMAKSANSSSMANSADSSTMAASGAALALNVGGFIDFQAGFTDQDSAFEGTGAAGNSREFKTQNDTEIHVRVDGKTDSGINYGAVIELNADVSGDADGDGGNADKTYIYVGSDAFGRVELGANSGSTTTMNVNAASIARATGGVDGDWYDFVNTTASTGAGFILTPELPAAASAEGGTREDANKITYYTPSFSGVTLGVSFTPDEGDSGTAAAFTGDLGNDQENVFDIAIGYDQDYDNVNVKASIIGEIGESENAGIEDTNAWGLGLAVASQGFSVAGSYADWSDSGLAVGTVNDDQKVWTLGAAYEQDQFGVSLTYLDSESQDNELTNLALGADYQLAPGLVTYVDVSLFDMDGAGTTVDNDGSVILIGTELSF